MITSLSITLKSTQKREKHRLLNVNLPNHNTVKPSIPHRHLVFNNTVRTTVFNIARGIGENHPFRSAAGVLLMFDESA